MESVDPVCVVGGGAAGALTALHLVRELSRLPGSAGPREVVVLDPAPALGQGVAFGTTDHRLLLNVRSSGMSAYPDRPEHFVQWRAERHPDSTPDDFAPRAEFAAYVDECLTREVATSRGLRLVHRRELVTDVSPVPEGDGAVVSTASGDTLRASAVVVATGVNPPGTAWAPAALASSDRFVADPWAPGAWDRITAAGDLLVVGTGLTMVDVVLATADRPRRVTAVSRSGALPTVHRVVPSRPVEPELPGDVDLDVAVLRTVVRDHLEQTVRAGGDWRAAMDGLRPHTAGLWQRLCPDCRASFLREDAGTWDRHRHRMAPSSATSLAALRASGHLGVRAGEVVAAREVDGGIEVTLSEGTTLVVDLVVNCTGPAAAVQQAASPVVGALLASGSAVPGPLDLGLATDGTGRLLDALGETGPLWTLGALRRGELWESTAVPEIRGQAAEVARALAAPYAATTTVAPAVGGPVTTPTPPIRRPRDLMGLSLSTTSEAAAAYNEGLARVLRVQGGADEHLRRAVELDPGFAAAHAALALLAFEGGGPGDVTADLLAAQVAVQARGDERERSLVEVVTQRVRDVRGNGARELVRHIGEHPRDALAVSAAVPTIAFSGVTDVQAEAWELVESLAPAYGDDWWYAGLLAFVRQDQGRYDEADALARGALAAEPAAGHAVHAQTHVFYETGQHDAGLAWLDPWISTSGRSASHLAHYSWHAALHELSLGRISALRARFDSELAPPHVTGVRALVDTASLLWRCQMTDSWSGDSPLASVLDLVGTDLLEHPSTPFTAMHAALALTAAKDTAGLSRLRVHAAQSGDPVMRDVVVSLCDALVAVAEERWHEAVRVLRLLGPWLVQLGGSAAQREIIEDTLLFALVRAGRCGEARRLLEVRLDRRPSPLDLRRLAGVPGV